ncbi:fungal-specific transcription factor domain-containing protein [Xylogone sp. PMI_703]|nr:fungal-specific transcription factor domain-containing protein [Xylogone sp. PMI_703]
MDDSEDTTSGFSSFNNSTLDTSRDNWSGLSSPLARRKIQNRLAQRAYRHRQALIASGVCSRPDTNDAHREFSITKSNGETSVNALQGEPDIGSDEGSRSTIVDYMTPKVPAKHMPLRQWKLVDITKFSQAKGKKSGMIRNNLQRDQSRNYAHDENEPEAASKTGASSSQSAKEYICGPPDILNASRAGDSPRRYPLENNPGYSQSLMFLPGTGAGDPFKTYVGPNFVQADQLFYHFTTVLAPALLPVGTGQTQNPLRIIFVGEAIRNLVLFHATLFLASAHDDFLHGNKNNPVTLLHRGETIRLINASLNSTTVHEVNDATIAAVTCLAAYENINGNVTDLALHMNAVERIVTSKGGLRVLGMQSVLHMLISWQDSLSSTITDSTPRFTPTKCVVTTNPIILNVDSISDELSYPTSLDSCKRALPISFSGELVSIFHDLRRITLIVNYFSRGYAPTTMEMMNFSQMRTSIERRLLHFLKQHESRPVKLQDKSMMQVFSIAGLIYINYALRHFLPTFAVLRSLKLKLMDQYIGEKFFIINNVDNASLGIQLWALCMGSVISLGDAENVWFAARVARVMAAMELNHWKEVEGRLIGLLWNKRMSEVIGGMFWREVELRKQSLEQNS